jgi:hypothetical protein
MDADNTPEAIAWLSAQISYEMNVEELTDAFAKSESTPSMQPRPTA